MAKLIFFDKDHTYQVDGETIPSVSEILRFISREVYESATQWRLDNAADRGKRVHEACESLDRFRSCEIDADFDQYVKAYINFLKEVKPSWSLIEHSAYHETLKYAGAVDRYGVVNGKRFVVDIKTNSQIKPALVGAQVNAYAILLQSMGKPVDGVAVLHLKNDGTYRFREMPLDQSVFMACLTLHNALKTKKRRRNVEDGTKDSE